MKNLKALLVFSIWAVLLGNIQILGAPYE